MNIFPSQFDSVIELSERQQRLLENQQLDVENPVFNVYCAFTLTGATPALIQESAELLCQRHPILQSTIKQNDGQSVLVLPTSGQSPLPFSQVDISENTEKAKAWCQHQIEQVFELEKQLFQCSYSSRLDDQFLFFNAHHLICDQWSLQLIVNDFLAIFEAIINKKDISLPEVEYLNRAKNADKTSIDRHDNMALGNKEKGSVDEIYPFEFYRTITEKTANSFSGIAVLDKLSKSIKELTSASQHFSVSHFTIVLSCMFMTLFRLKGDKQLTIGVPIARRSRKSRFSIGHLVDLVPVTIENIDSYSVATLIDTVDSKIKDALYRGDCKQTISNYQVNVVCNYLAHLKIKGMRPGLMSVIAGLSPYPLLIGEQKNIEVRGFQIKPSVAQVDLEMTLFEANDSVCRKVIGRGGIFDKDELLHINQLFDNYLAQVVLQENKPVCDLLIETNESFSSLLKPDVLAKQNQVSREHILGEIAQAVIEFPENIALESSNKKLTYRALSIQIDNAARALQAEGLCAGNKIALLLNKSIETIVLLLGAWRAGLVTAPFDPAWPAERRNICIEQAEIDLIIYHNKPIDSLAVRSLPIANFVDIMAEKKVNPGNFPELNAESHAYIIFTSGTSGMPKGVLVNHTGLANLANAQRKLFNVKCEDRVLQFASLAFDAAISEIIVTLSAGATLVIAEQQEQFSHDKLIATLNYFRISSVTLPPSLLQILTPEELPYIKSLISAGEACPRNVQKKWATAVRFVNAYGPTECSVCVTAKVISTDTRPNNIGQAISGFTVFILDSNKRQLLTSCWGELAVSGIGLAHGYIQQPDVTAAVFINNPFIEGERLYLTGDRARKLPNGEIEIAGRIDQQIKIRGYRIEPEEISQRLSDHPMIRQACVILTNNQSGDCLSAFYTCETSEQINKVQLHAYLKELMPNYMVPKLWQQLEAFPLNSSGKVDKKALQLSLASELVNEVQEDESSELTAEENYLCTQWAHLLGFRPRVHENLFEIGIDSLQISLIKRKVDQAFKCNLKIKDFYLSNTIAKQGKLLNEDRKFTSVVEDNQQQLAVADSYNRPSLTQERLWFIETHASDVAHYNIPIGIRLEGSFNYETLEECLSYVVNRHEALRTTFILDKGQPKIKVADVIELPLERLDFTQYSPEQALEETVRIFQEQLLCTKFNLSQGPLLRCCLIKLSEDDHVLVIIFHHIISDAVSCGIFFEELTRCWRENRQNIKSNWLAPSRYSDYANWQINWVNSRHCQKQKNFWLEYLGTSPARLDFPKLKTSVSVNINRGGTLRFAFPESLSNAMQVMAKKYHCSENMLYLATFQLLISRYSQQDEFVIAMPISNRDQNDHAGTIGFFINTLLIKAVIEAEKPFTSLLEKVKMDSLNIFEHGDLPYNSLLDSLNKESNHHEKPLTDVLFSWIRDEDLSLLKLDGIKLSRFEVDSPYAKFPITLNLMRRSDTVHGCMEYSEDVFNDSFARAFIENWQTLCEHIVSDPGARQNSYPLLDKSKLNNILHDRNNNEVSLPEVTSFIELFEQHVAEQPEKMALIFTDEHISYQQLNTFANNLSVKLRLSGVNVGDRVAICLPRGIELVTCMIAVLKAGATYVPVSLDYPQERIQYLINSTQCKQVIAQPGSLDKNTLCCPVVAPDFSPRSEIETIKPHSTEINEIACILFTSGSTGLPKRVPVQHKSVIRTVCNSNFVSLTAQDVISHLSNISFDAALFEIWGALLNGASLVILSKDITLNPAKLQQQISTQKITTLFMTTALFHEIARIKPSAFNGLKTVLTGGQAASVTLMERVIDQCQSPIEVINGYGPTECTFFATYYRLSRDEHCKPCQFETKHAPIGRAISNTQLFVLDQNNQVVPDGVWGELHIAGLGVSAGYLDDPELNEQKFKQLTFENIGSIRAYATGDKVRYLPDGNLEYGSRLDSQLKIRGFRVEPGEVESVLTSHSEIANAAVKAFTDSSDELYLIAYVVTFSGTAATDTHLTEAQVMHYLNTRLPEYARPRACVFLQQLPITANGKTDYQAFVAPKLNQEGVEQAVLSASNWSEIEVKVAGIWREILGVDEIHDNTNYFAAGGQSILGMRLLCRLEDELNISCTIETLFNTRNFRDFLDNLTVTDSTALPAIPSSVKSEIEPIYYPNDIYPMSYAQERLWVIQQLDSASISYNMPFTFSVSGHFDVNMFTQALAQLVERHCILHTVFKRIAGKPQQQVLSTFIPEIIQLDYDGDIDDNELWQLLKTQASEPFELSKLPLFKVVQVKLEPELSLFMLNIHHIIADGWSVRLFQEEVSTIYQSLIKGNTYDLSTLPVQVKDIALWERSTDGNQQLAQGINYWQKHLPADYQPLELPLDHPRPQFSKHEGKIIEFVIDEALVSQCTALCQQRNITPYLIGLTTFSLMLRAYSNKNTILIGVPFANRSHPASQPLIGFFVNILPVLIEIDDDSSFLQLLDAVKTQFYQTLSRQNTPFDRIVDSLGVERSGTQNPLFNLVFDSRSHGIKEELDQGSTQFKHLPFDIHTSKFDATFTLVESKGSQSLAIEYDSQLFDEHSIRRFADNFLCIYRQVLHGGNIRALSSISTQELIALNDYSEQRCSYPVDYNLALLFEKNALRYADNIAVSYEGQSLSYLALDCRANQFAAALIKQGIQAENFVAVHMERSVDLIAAILGILKIGAAYIPLDIHVPEQRLQVIIEDAKIAAFIIDKKPNQSILNSELPLISPGDLSSYSTEKVVSSKRNPLLPAYVIFTSGSTGKPKGVMVNHHNVIRLMRASNKHYGFDQSDVFSLFHSYGFDVSVWEMWGALLHGGRIAIVPQQVCQAPDQFNEFIIEENITVLSQTPSAFFTLLKVHLSNDARRFNDLRHIIFAGEELNIIQLTPWFARYQNSGPKLVNMYGITETTVHSTYREITQATIDGNRGSVIGRQLDDLSIYILNKQGQRVPFGVPGEIFIGGGGVTLGYLNRPELNKERFQVKNIGGEEKRLYRSGDLAKLLPDGELVYLGRIDNQVKIRGFRIELGEIEKVIAELPEIQACQVVVWERSKGDKCLVAYVIINDDSTEIIDESKIKSMISGKLPNYMLPAYFLTVAKFPLNANGKTDKPVLLKQLQNKLSAPVDQPRSDLVLATTDNLAGEALRAIWQKVLKRTDFNDTDNFFSLGGDSISAIEVVSDAARRGLNFTAKQFFATPTLSELTKNIVPVTLQDKEQHGRYGSVALTPIQRWFFQQNINNQAHWNQSAIFDISPRVNVSQLKDAVSQLAINHDIFTTVFFEEQGQQTQWSQEHKQNYNVVTRQLSWASDEECRRKIEIYAQSLHKEINPWGGCNLIFALIEGKNKRLNQQENYLFVVCHHLFIDGLSWRILIKDLVQLIEEPSMKLPAPQNSYRDWSELLLKTAQSAQILMAVEKYWLNNDWSKVENISYKVIENTEKQAETLAHSLTGKQTQSLLSHCKKTRCTLEEYLLAQLILSFEQVFSWQQIAVDMEHHGREVFESEKDFSRTVGWFTSLYPMLLTVEHDNADIVGALKEQIRAVPDNGVPFTLARYLNLDTSLRQKLADIPSPWLSFNYLGQLNGGEGNSSSEDRSLIGPPLHHLSTGINTDENAKRSHLVDVIFWLDGELLKSKMIVNKALLDDKFIEFCQVYKSSLSDLSPLISSSLSQLWPSDFCLNSLDKVELIQLSQQVLEQDISPDNIQDVYPMTPVQEGIAFDAMINPATGVYICQMQWTFSGDFQQETFIDAWRQVVSNHDILRSSFHFFDSGESAQVVHNSIPLPLTEFDLSECENQQQQLQQLQQLLDDAQSRDFDFKYPGQFRLQLVKLSEGSLLFSWTYHHIILDGWSQSMLLKELFQIVQQQPQNKTPPFSHYVSFLQQQDNEKDKLFWREYLSELPESRVISVQKRQETCSENFKQIEQVFSVQKTAELVLFCKQQHITLNTLLQGSWALALASFCSSEQVVFGITLAGRPPQLKDSLSIIGLFINTLPLRVNTAVHQSVGDFFRQIAETQNDLMAHQYTSQSQLKKLTDLENNQEIYESILVFENYPIDKTMMSGEKVNINNISTRENTAFPLTLTIGSSDSLDVQLSYKTTDYRDQDMKALLDYTIDFIAKLTIDPDMTLRESLIDTSADLAYLTVNNAENKTHAEHTLIDNLQCLVDKHPDNIALQRSDESLTYRELAHQSDCVAHYLSAQGCKRGQAIVLSMDRSIGFIVAIIGIWKAGCVYVPVDPSFPLNRIKYILGNTQSPLCFVDKNQQGTLMQQDLPQCKLAYISDAIGYTKSSGNIEYTLPKAGDLAYIIFTSGSTGQPKGVEITHKSLTHQIYWQNREFGLQQSDRYLLTTPAVFDASVNTLFSFMVNGGCLIISLPQDHTDPDRFIALAKEQNITILHLVPSMLDLLMQNKAFKNFNQLRYVQVGGEPLNAITAEKFYRCMPNCELINLYGPTECTVDSVFWRVPKSICANDKMKIGKTTDHISALVVDHNLKSLPVGVTGELLLSGNKVGQGYCHAPELTRTAFLTINDIRFYRTGDLVWQDEEGEFHYVGRKDQQVKINGVRLELAEIEVQIASNPLIREVAVVVRKLAHLAGKSSLVAYWVSNNDNEIITIQDLRKFASLHLPATHQPGIYVQLNSLPRLPSLKIDRKQLPEIEMNENKLPGRAAENLIELALIEILAPLLNCTADNITMEDSYFSLGGDSLIAIQVVSKLKHRGLSISLKDFVSMENIGEIAAACQPLRETAAIDQLPKVTRTTGPLVPIQARFFAEDFADNHHWNQAFSFTITERIQAEFLTEVLNRLSDVHDVFNLRFKKEANQWHQSIDKSVTGLSLEVIDLANCDDDELSEQIKIISGTRQSELNLTSGPIGRVVLYNCGIERPQKLVFILHHLVIDMMGWRVIFEDLQTLVDSSDPDQITLPDATTSYIEWAHHLNDHQQVFAHELDYWLTLPFERANPVPVDFVNGCNTEAEVDTVSTMLSVERTEQLLRKIPSQFGTQINDALVTALYQIIAEWTSSACVAISLEGHGREDIPDAPWLDVSRTLGWFTKIYPVVLEIKGQLTLTQILAEIKTQLNQIPNKGTGYGILRYGSNNKELSTDQWSTPEIEFNYLGQFGEVSVNNTKMMISNDDVGRLHSQKAHRSALIGIDCFINQGQMFFHWSYSKKVHHKNTIAHLAKNYIAVIEALCDLSIDKKSYLVSEQI